MDKIAGFWQHVGEILSDTNTTDEQKVSEIRHVLDHTDATLAQTAREQFLLIGRAFESDEERIKREERERATAEAHS